MVRGVLASFIAVGLFAVNAQAAPLKGATRRVKPVRIAGDVIASSGCALSEPGQNCAAVVVPIKATIVARSAGNSGRRAVSKVIRSNYDGHFKAQIPAGRYSLTLRDARIKGAPNSLNVNTIELNPSVIDVSDRPAPLLLMVRRVGMGDTVSPVPNLLNGGAQGGTPAGASSLDPSVAPPLVVPIATLIATEAQASNSELFGLTDALGALPGSTPESTLATPAAASNSSAGPNGETELALLENPSVETAASGAQVEATPTSSQDPYNLANGHGERSEVCFINFNYDCHFVERYPCWDPVGVLPEESDYNAQWRMVLRPGGCERSMSKGMPKSKLISCNSTDEQIRQIWRATKDSMYPTFQEVFPNESNGFSIEELNRYEGYDPSLFGGRYTFEFVCATYTSLYPARPGFHFRTNQPIIPPALPPA